jgi:hypothetical protein
VVTDDPTVALQEVGRGANVVLIVGEHSRWPGEIPFSSTGPVGEGAGRLAVMVGDPSDPSTQAAAQEMHDELFSTRR